MADQIKMTIGADKLDNVVCECGNIMFMTAIQLKDIPALYSPSGKPERLMIQSGFLCTNCGKMIPLRPDEKIKINDEVDKTDVVEKDNVFEFGGGKRKDN